VLQKISLLSSLLPIIFFVIFCFKKATRELWVFFIVTLASCIFDILLTMSKWAFENIFLLWNLSTLVLYVLLIYFFYLIIKQNVIRIIIILLSIFYFILFFLYDKSNTEQFNSLMNTIGYVIYLILSLCYLIIALKPTSEPTNIFTPIFLIVLGLLISIASTFFLFIIASRLSKEEVHQYWSLNYYSNIVSNIIFSIAFFKSRNKRKNQPPENHLVDFTIPNDR